MPAKLSAQPRAFRLAPLFCCAILASGLVFLAGKDLPWHSLAMADERGLGSEVSADRDRGAELANTCETCACGGPRTLLQWSYGTSFSGGADLDSPLVTDRPDFTECSTTVGRGVRQVEMGYTFYDDAEPDERFHAHSFPEMLVRVGVWAEWLELRVGFNYANQRTIAGPVSTTTNGAEDLYVGAKLALTPQEGVLPEMALMPQMSVPTGSREIGTGEVLPGLSWLYGWDISDALTTAGSTQINREIDEATDRAYVSLAQSWTVALCLTERLGAYTECFAILPDGADAQLPEYYFNGGLTFLVHNNLQLDVRAGLGLNESATDFFSGAGAAIRF